MEGPELLDELVLPDGLVRFDSFEPVEHFDFFPPFVECDERLRHAPSRLADRWRLT